MAQVTNSSLKYGRVTASAKDKAGIHDTIHHIIRTAGYSIIETSGKSKDGYYFLRDEFSNTTNPVSLPDLQRRLKEALAPLNLENLHLGVEDAEKKKKAAILVSEQTYCLDQLLYQWSHGALNLEIACVISNSREAERIVKFHGIDFHYVNAGQNHRDRPTFDIEKFMAEQEICRLTADTVDLYILAKWHRLLFRNGPVLSSGKTIMSVHPSLLPAFKGANAIRQAYEAGVKTAGPTVHLVTNEDEGVDEGPKILQMPKNVDKLRWPEFEKAVQFAEMEALYDGAKIIAESRWEEYTDPVSGKKKTYIF